MAKVRRRLDVFLVERGFFPTRAKAQAAVMAGQVLVGGKAALKAGEPVGEDASIQIVASCPYVSRGGLKLEAALDAFALDVSGRVCLDVGASTGGFTDCLLQRGAARVYAVDVGRGQLDAKLRADPRVASREKTHARELQPSWFSPRPTLAVLDVSFISLTRVLAPALACLEGDWDAVALIKPQFEVGPKLAPKGIVRDEEARRQAIEKIRSYLPSLPAAESGLIESPARGAKGNVEYLIRLGPVKG